MFGGKHGYLTPHVGDRRLLPNLDVRMCRVKSSWAYFLLSFITCCGDSFILCILLFTQTYDRQYISHPHCPLKRSNAPLSPSLTRPTKRPEIFFGDHHHSPSPLRSSISTLSLSLLIITLRPGYQRIDRHVGLDAGRGAGQPQYQHYCTVDSYRYWYRGVRSADLDFYLDKE